MLPWLLLACTPDPPPPAPEKPLPFEQRQIDEAGMVRAFPADRVKKDREGWARDTLAVLRAHDIPTTNGNACAVVAVVEQESNYDPDPKVPGIGGMIDAWIDEKQAEMGKVQGFVFEAGLKTVLDVTPPGQNASFYSRLKAAQTERDVDVVFREFVDYRISKLPKPLQRAQAAAEVLGFDPDELNPITTSGCMQVKVALAAAHAATHGADPDTVRDALYTREGCLHYGVVRLLGWEAGYDKPIYRFADYNAGYYSSRNAAFQAQISALTGVTLALDGDLLRYSRGRPAPEPSQTLSALLPLAPGLSLTERRLRSDLEREKERGLEETDTWTSVRDSYTKKTGTDAPYAQLPDVALDSIKIKGDKTTAWFARNVQHRYDACITRVKGGK